MMTRGTFSGKYYTYLILFIKIFLKENGSSWAVFSYEKILFLGCIITVVIVYTIGDS